jgi:hypothetical protein
MFASPGYNFCINCKLVNLQQLDCNSVHAVNGTVVKFIRVDQYIDNSFPKIASLLLINSILINLGEHFNEDFSCNSGITTD